MSEAVIAEPLVTEAESRVAVATQRQLIWWRFRKHKLAVVSAPASQPSSDANRSVPIAANVTALHAVGATALKTEPEAKLSPAQALETLPWQEPKREAKAQVAERRAEDDPDPQCEEHRHEGQGVVAEVEHATSARGGSGP